MPLQRFYSTETCTQLYHSDPMFKAAVDSLLMLIERMHLTPGEVRSIGVFASTLSEMQITARQGSYDVDLPEPPPIEIGREGGLPPVPPPRSG